MSAMAASRPCPRPGCPNLMHGTAKACPEHTKAADARRGSSRARGYDAKWERARASYLAAHPLCAYAARHGRTELANVVDHIRPHRGDRTLFWDPLNWQPLSTAAHGAKTRREQGAPCPEHGQAATVLRGILTCHDCGMPEYLTHALTIGTRVQDVRVVAGLPSCAVMVRCGMNESGDVDLLFSHPSFKAVRDGEAVPVEEIRLESGWSISVTGWSQPDPHVDLARHCFQLEIDREGCHRDRR